MPSPLTRQSSIVPRRLGVTARRGTGAGGRSRRPRQRRFLTACRHTWAMLPNLHRSGEIRQLRWSYLEPDVIRIPGSITKNGEEEQIALTEEIEEILARRRSDRRPVCDLIFHHDGEPIVDYRKCWYSACVCLGLGAYYCRDCRDAQGRHTSKLNVDKRCSVCGKWWGENPKYIGRIFHDFRRSAAPEVWKAGSSVDDCMKITGPKTSTCSGAMQICSAMRRSVHNSAPYRASAANGKRHKRTVWSLCRSGQPSNRTRTQRAHLRRGA